MELAGGVRGRGEARVGRGRARKGRRQYLRRGAAPGAWAGDRPPAAETRQNPRRPARGEEGAGCGAGRAEGGA